MYFEKTFNRWINNRGISKAIIFLHKDPDGDAIGSAAAISTLFRLNGVDSCVICAASPSQIKHYNWVVKNIPKDWEQEVFTAVVVDTRTPKRIAKEHIKFLRQAKNVLVVDHHANFDIDEWKQYNKSLDTIYAPEYFSCCELLTDLVLPIFEKHNEEGKHHEELVETVQMMAQGIYMETSHLHKSCEGCGKRLFHLQRLGAQLSLLPLSTPIHNWWKVRYMAHVMSKAYIDKTNGRVVVLQSSRTEQLTYAPEYMHREINSSQPPYGMLGIIRRENFRANQYGTDASIIIYNTESGARNHLLIFVDLYTGSKEKQNKMLGKFPVAHTHNIQCTYIIPTNLDDLQKVLKSLTQVVVGLG